MIAGVRDGRARGILAPALRMQEAGYANRWAPILDNHDRPRFTTEVKGSMAKSKTGALLLLTLPGIPFLYYGGEIGMIGAKPDERLRTPMQWRAGAGGGFTSGKPWEPFAADSATITVAAQDRDPSSLLNLTRRLIHLRAQNSALSSGQLVPLTSSSDAVVAYARRDGSRVVVVVANLGDRPLEEVSISSLAGALPPGYRRARDMLGGATPAPVRVDVTGRIENWRPIHLLAPNGGYLFELTTPTR
jgi:glycosidase